MYRRNIGYRRGSGMGKLLITAGIALMAGTCSVAEHFTRDTYSVKIVGTERVTSSSTDSEGRVTVSSKYLVHAEDIITAEPRSFENTDSLVECLFSRCKVDSSDLQARVKSAEKSSERVKVTAYGWRIPLFSSYQNLIDVQKE